MRRFMHRKAATMATMRRIPQPAMPATIGYLGLSFSFDFVGVTGGTGAGVIGISMRKILIFQKSVSEIEKRLVRHLLFVLPCNMALNSDAASALKDCSLNS